MTIGIVGGRKLRAGAAAEPAVADACGADSDDVGLPNIVTLIREARPEPGQTQCLAWWSRTRPSGSGLRSISSASVAQAMAICI